MKRIRSLSFAVIDIDSGVSDGTGEFLIPCVIQKDHKTLQWKSFTHDWRNRIPRIAFDTDIYRRIVHVVFDAFSKYVLKPKSVLCKFDIGAQVDSPTGNIATQIKLVIQNIVVV